MSVTLQIVPTYPRWGRAYIGFMLALTRVGVAIDEDAVVDRVRRATKWEAVDARGNRQLLEV